MKNNAFIIAEYNPFHNGHLYHIRKTVESGADNIICIMSGNFVQRGEPAFCDKSTRARFALMNGADLVLELPPMYVLSGAKFYAAGAAKIISACNIPGTLSFGAINELEDLKYLAERLGSEHFVEKASELIKLYGMSYPSAVKKVITDEEGECKAKILDDANSVLACEYISALSKLNCDVDFFAVKRDDSLIHDSETPSERMASAKFLRDSFNGEKAQNVLKNISPFMPDNVFEIIADECANGFAPYSRDKFSAAAMTKLISLNSKDFSLINGVNQGLENRIYDCIKDNNDIYSLYDAVKTKRFTHSRIRQILVSAFIGIQRSDLDEGISYIRVLGFSDKGRKLLHKIKIDSDIPFVSILSDAPDCREKELDIISGKLYELIRPVPKKGNVEFEIKPFISEH